MLTFRPVCKDYTQVKSYLEGKHMLLNGLNIIVFTLTVAEQLRDGKRNILPLDD